MDTTNSLVAGGIISLFFLFPLNAQAQCAHDLTGLDETAPGFQEFEETRLSGANARDLDDFAYAAANEIFFSPEGEAFMQRLNQSWSSFAGQAGSLAVGSGIVPAQLARGAICNNNGQCRNVQLRINFATESSEAAGGWLSFLTGESIDASAISGFRVSQFEFVTDDGNGNSSNTLRLTPRQIWEQIQSQEPFQVGDPGQPADNRCRDNNGTQRPDNSQPEGGDEQPWTDNGGAIFQSYQVVYQCYSVDRGYEVARVCVRTRVGI